MINRLDVRDAVIRIDGEDGSGFSLELPVLRLEAGAKLALTGPSGSGKTTVLEFLALLRRPERIGVYNLGLLEGGTMELAEPLRRGQLDRIASLRAGPIAYVAQAGGVLPFLDAYGNALAGVRAGGGRIDAAVREHLRVCAATLGLQEHLRKGRSELSGGERRRLGLLRVFAVPRALIIADEPTSALDDAMADCAFAELALRCEEQGTVCVIATHDLIRAARYGFTIWKIDEVEPGVRKLVSHTEVDV